MKYIYILPFLSLLTACYTPPPLETYSMEAGAAVYNQVEKDFFLKKKIALSPITADTGSESTNHILSNATQAAQTSLSKANLLSETPDKAPYILSGKIKNVAINTCWFGTCESGSAIEYTLTQAGTTVYKDTLVVPFNYEYPAFGADMNFVYRMTQGGAIGNNFAHLIHVLTSKNQGDLK